MVDAAQEQPRNLLRERLEHLGRLRRPGRKPLDLQVRTNLETWVEQGHRPNTILIRPEFVRRIRKLTRAELDGHRLIDRPKPKLPRQPPLAYLTTRPRGVGLRTALTLLFLVQTRPGVLGHDKLLGVPVEATDGQPGLIDLIAIDARHDPPPTTHLASSVKENRKRQIRGGLLQLAADDLQMVELPPGGRGRPRFTNVHLNIETGAHDKAHLARYRVPSPSAAEVITVPIEFFLNGWIHALTNREIAMWLMLRDLDGRSDDFARVQVPGQNGHRLQIDAQRRLTEYDLTRSTWDSHQELEAFGLLEVIRDENRRANGTTLDGQRALPHRFLLLDDGLGRDAVSNVIPTLKSRMF